MLHFGHLYHGRSITLLYSGNMGMGHELETLVRAVSNISSSLDLHVLMVGQGKGRGRIVELAADLNLSNVEFQPPVPLYSLPQLLASGDIHYVSQKPGTQGVIVPSKIYGVLAAARPTLFVGPADCEPAMIVAKSQSGIVVEPGDVSGMAAAIRTLASDRNLRQAMGKRARAYYEQNFGRDRSVSRIVSLIESYGFEKHLAHMPE